MISTVPWKKKRFEEHWQRKKRRIKRYQHMMRIPIVILMFQCEIYLIDLSLLNLFTKNLLCIRRYLMNMISIEKKYWFAEVLLQWQILTTDLAE